MHCFTLPSAFTVKRMKMTAKVTMGLILMLLSYLLPNKAEINPGKHRDPELLWTDPSGCSTTDPTRFPSHPCVSCYWLFPRSVFNSPQKTHHFAVLPLPPPQKKKSITLLFSLYLYLEIVPEHNIQTETRFKAKSYCFHFLKKVTWTWMLPDNIYHQPSENSYLILF